MDFASNFQRKKVWPSEFLNGRAPFGSTNKGTTGFE